MYMYRNIYIYISHVVVSGHYVNTVITALYVCVQMEFDVCYMLYCVLDGSALLPIVSVSALNAALDG